MMSTVYDDELNNVLIDFKLCYNLRYNTINMAESSDSSDDFIEFANSSVQNLAIEAQDVTKKKPNSELSDEEWAYGQPPEGEDPYLETTNDHSDDKKDVATQCDVPRYLVEFDEQKMLGKGSYGRVYKATHKIDKQPYAVKKVNLAIDIETQAFREVCALANLKHECIVGYHTCWKARICEVDPNSSDSEGSSNFSDYTESDKTRSSSVQVQMPSQERLYIQLELCDESLDVWINCRNENISPTDCYKVVDKEQVASIILQTLRGIAFMHDKGYIHRDLKPANILLKHKSGVNGVTISVKLGDLGLVRQIGEISQSNIQESLSKDVGTSPYASPEQRLSGGYDFKTDMFSFGILLFEVLQPFSTDCEKYKVLEKLGKETYIPEDFRKKYGLQLSKVITQLVQEAAGRPSAKDMVEFWPSLISNQVFAVDE